MITCVCGYTHVNKKGMAGHKKACDGTNINLKSLLSCTCGYNTTVKARMKVHQDKCKKLNYNPNVNYIFDFNPDDIEQQRKWQANCVFLLTEKKTSDVYISRKIKAQILNEINLTTKLINNYENK